MAVYPRAALRDCAAPLCPGLTYGCPFGAGPHFLPLDAMHIENVRVRKFRHFVNPGVSRRLIGIEYCLAEKARVATLV